MEAVIKLIATNLDIQVEDIKPDAEIRDLVEDSLDRIELIMAFEDEFDINIADEDIDKLITVGDIDTYIEGKVREQSDIGGER